MSEFKRLAKIEKAELGFEDHGILGFNLSFRLDSNTHQGTGWYSLGDNGGKIIRSILNAVGVNQWKDLEGKTVYALQDSADEYSSRLIGIEKLPTEARGGVVLFADWSK